MIWSHTCWFPGLFLANDFTVPGAATSQGRRQEPCSTPHHLPAALTNTFAFLAPPSFGPRFRTGKQQNPFLGLLETTIRACQLFPRFISQFGLLTFLFWHHADAEFR
jgi:hypothetical protein